MLHCGRVSSEVSASRGAMHHTFDGLHWDHVSQHWVAELLWLLHSGDSSGNVFLKSCKGEEEAMTLILISMEIWLKRIHFSLFSLRVKLVLLVLLVLVVVLEREENLVLRVMLGHLGLRYVNTTWEQGSGVPAALHKASQLLWFKDDRLAASI